MTPNFGKWETVFLGYGVRLWLVRFAQPDKLGQYYYAGTFASETDALELVNLLNSKKAVPSNLRGGHWQWPIGKRLVRLC